jgi:ADP-ribosylglycohydrolase
MRVSPLGVFGWRRPVEELIGWAREDARLTHPNRTCQDASAVFVAAIALAVREGADPADVHAHAVEVATASGAAPDVLEALERAATEPPPYTPQDGFVLVALQNAFFQLLHAASVEEGLIATVAGGGDTDTNAAIAGALLGAVHGAEAIPLRWRNAVLSCRPLAGLPGVKRPRPVEYWPVDALVLAEWLVAQGSAPRS